MSAETLERLCKEAMQRVIYRINRSAGQHVRAMKNNWSKYHE